MFAVWALELTLSPVWLTYFRYGPAEWLWRTLTYWKFQPMRVHPEQPLLTRASSEAIQVA